LFYNAFGMRPDNPDRMFDKRVVRRNIQAGRVSREDYNAFLETLPDVNDNIRAKGEGGDDDGYDHPRSLPAAAPAASEAPALTMHSPAPPQYPPVSFPPTATPAPAPTSDILGHTPYPTAAAPAADSAVGVPVVGAPLGSRPPSQTPSDIFEAEPSMAATEGWDASTIRREEEDDEDEDEGEDEDEDDDDEDLAPDDVVAAPEPEPEPEPESQGNETPEDDGSADSDSDPTTP